MLIWNARDARVENLATPDGSNPAAVPAVDLAGLKRKAAAGDSEAAYQLGRALVKGEDGLPNYSEAAGLYRAAVDKGHVEAMVGLAELYTIGQGVTNNPAEAMRLFLTAARKGNVKALYSLAGLYEEGRGVKKDQALATQWHKLAAERGLALAQFNLGQRYDLGMGVKSDFVEALKWLSLASKSGIGEASELTVPLEKKMTKDQIVEAKRRVNGFSIVTALPSLSEGLSQ